jgi:predicted oxidoreductase (fatty acid repression mutant protein)
MQAYELPAHINAVGEIELPPNATLPRSFNNQSVRVIVLLRETDAIIEQTQWKELTATQFLAGYSAADAVYDED